MAAHERRQNAQIRTLLDKDLNDGHVRRVHCQTPTEKVRMFWSRCRRHLVENHLFLLQMGTEPEPGVRLGSYACSTGSTIVRVLVLVLVLGKAQQQIRELDHAMKLSKIVHVLYVV